MENNSEFKLLKFMQENKKAGNIYIDTCIDVENLWNQYKLHEVGKDCTIITADFGVLGSIILREIVELENKSQKLKYESGNYDFVSIKCKTRKILWTDYQDIEPYNRNSGLYCDGASFEHLGSTIKETPEYREFDCTYKNLSSICFGVWGFDYNDFYGSIRFGMCIKNELVDEFIVKLRQIIKK